MVMDDQSPPPASTITREGMFVPLLDADPSFQPLWNEFVEEWDGEELPQYLALSDLARHLISKLETGETDRFGAVFDVVERWQTEGEHYVAQAAVIGLLESLQNEGLHTSTRPEDFARWLRPHSASWWMRLVEFWNGDVTALRNAS
jgi:hypothetical protein